MAGSQPLIISLVTFNCARNLVDSSQLASKLLSALPTSAAILPDIVALSLQEIAPIANSFLGGTLIEPYLDVVAQTVSLAALDRIQSHRNGNGSAAQEYEQGDPGLVHVLTRHVGLTALMIFARPEIKSRVRWIKTAGAGCGLWEMGNKGAVGARLGLEIAGVNKTTSVAERDDGGDIADSSVFEVTFVAAHLAPHEQNVDKRNQDFETIVRNLGFTDEQLVASSSPPIKQRLAVGEEEEDQRLLSSNETDPGATGLYDTDGLVFFAGDLNYRTAPSRPRPQDVSTYPQPADIGNSASSDYTDWLSRDQLRHQLSANKTLHHFSEDSISFPPTYKYSHGKQNQTSLDRADTDSETDSGGWNWAPHRWPSWCDRILFLQPLDKTSFLSYTALPQQHTSDHRPVALHVSVSPQQIKTAVASPYPLRLDYAAARTNARRLEIVVGALAYLGLTNEGKAILAGILAGAVASWYVVHSIL